jgi:4-amino-4-deoxy-L-arabinose transferase-like glycosyltransferase
MSARFANILVVIALIVLGLAILADSMTKPVARDEQMYCTAAVCVAQGKMIYRDFSYASQMPYHPLLCAGLFKLFGTTYYLLVGRLVSCVCDVLVMLCIVGIFRHIFKPFATTGVLFGLAAAVLYVFNPLLDYTNGYAWNHDVVILCVVLSFWLFVGCDFQQKSKHWRLAAIGLLLTLATFMRITTVLVELAFFVILLSVPAKSLKQRFQTALPFLIASALVSIWPTWIIAHAPRAFFLDMVKIPVLYGQWLHKIGMVYDKAALMFACLTVPGYLALLLLAVYLWVAILCLRNRLKITNGRNLLLSALLPLIFFAIALIPPTMWRQYLGVPVPFLVISLALPLSYLRKSAAKGKARDKSNVIRHFRIAVLVTILCASVAVLSYPVVLYRTPFALVPEKWSPIEVHMVSRDIVEKAKQPKRILTLAPLLALEGGGEIYTELSAGAVIYRIADSLSPDERRITHTVGLEGLPDLVKAKPPSAVILGVEMQRLEQPIFESAVKPDWERKNYENGPTAYFRP